MSERELSPSSAVSEALPVKWAELLNVVCEQKLDTGKISDILDLLLYDGEDVAENRMTGEVDEFSPCLTPVERLLLFVRSALGRLRSDSQGDLPYDPIHFPQLDNLRTLLWTAMRSEGRIFSELEKVRILGQWTSIQSSFQRIHPNEQLRSGVWRADAARLADFQEALARVPSGGIAVESLRAWAGYRNATRSLYARPRDVRGAARELAELLVRDSVTIPPGLYFRSTLLIARNPCDEFRQVLAANRLGIAATFTSLRSTRVSDRIAVLYLLALDALGRDGVASAERFLEGAQRIVAASQRVRPFGVRMRRDLSELQTRVRKAYPGQRTRSVVSRVPDLSQFQKALSIEIRTKFGHDPETRAEAVRELEIQGGDVRLYAQVLGAWFKARTGGGNAPDFSSDVEDVFGSSRRDDARLCRLLAIGQLTRVLEARGRAEIDRTLKEYKELLAIHVLGGDWENTVKTLRAWGYGNFLKNLGLVRTAERLEETAEYLRNVFEISPEAVQNRQDPVALDWELLGVRSKDTTTAGLRYELDHIDGVWRWENVRRWIGRNQGKFPKPMTCFKGEEHHLVSDMRTVVAAEKHLSEYTAADRAGVLRALASCSLQFVQVIQRAKFGPLPAPSRNEWLRKGVRWADELIKICEEMERWTTLYAGLEVRIRLGDAAQWSGSDPSARSKLRERMLELDARSLDTTQSANRRYRSAMKAERTIVEVMNRTWCSTFARPAPIADFRWLRLFQDLKTFNFRELVSQDSAGMNQSSGSALEDDETLPVEVPDEEYEESSASSLDEAWPHGWERLTADHLTEHNAAVLEFFTHPGGGAVDWRTEVGAARKTGIQGTVCFVVKPAGQRLVVRPVFLDVPQGLIRAVADGDSFSQGGEPFAGLSTELFRWGTEGPLTHPECVNTLGANLFSEELRNELDGISRLYLCGHRHLFRIPIHAMPLSDGSYPFAKWELMYALKLQHIVEQLLANARHGASDSSNRNDKYALIDVDSFPDVGSKLLSSTGSVNRWRQGGSTVEERILKPASKAHRAVIFCHGQMDNVRPTRARLRLWGGGRLVADDIHRLSGAVDLGASDWTIAACDAGSSRVGMQTAPGLAMSLVTGGARRVTSCLYKIHPQIAGEFISSFLHLDDYGDPAAFTKACRAVTGDQTSMTSWAKAASFVSYGLFGAG